MGRYPKIVAVVICAFAISSHARIAHVPSEYSTIQSGIYVCQDGDTVQVASGTYTGNGNRNITFGNRSILVESVSGADSTIINVQGSIQNPRRAFNFTSGEDSLSVLKGFTIKNGYDMSEAGSIYCSNSSPKITDCRILNGHSDNNAAGIYCTSNSHPIIMNCYFGNNVSYGQGGSALHFYHATADVRNCVFSHNTNMSGGAIGLEFSSGRIYGCLVDSNFAMFGGGMCLLYPDSAVIENCVFSHDTTDSQAGGVYCQGGTALFKGCWFIGNIAMDGAGLSCEFGAHVEMRNCLFIRNSGAEAGGGISLSGESEKLNLINCLFFENSSYQGAGLHIGDGATVNVRSTIITHSTYGKAVYCDDDQDRINFEYCNIYANQQGDWEDCLADQYGTHGNISVNPYYRNAQENDFHLKSIACGNTINSPCIDTGDPRYFDEVLDCTQGLGTSLCDMGAYGGSDTVISSINEDYTENPDRGVIIKNYPNPFNGSTIFDYFNDNPGNVSLKIFDITGRLVKVLLDETEDSGWHQTAFDGQALPTGVYLYCLRVGNRSAIGKLCLIK